MDANPQSTEDAGVRLSAATTRNRAALIRSAQHVLAEIGPDATVEQFVAHAEVSPTTIYNHFGSKEAMFSQALAQIFREWLEWAHDGIPADESLEVMIDVCRKLFRVQQSHPWLGRILGKTLDTPSFVIEALIADSLPAIEGVARLGQVSTAEFDKRTRLFAYCIAGILHGICTTQEMTAKDADLSLEIALALWGLAPDEAKAITSRSLEI
jgi:AcrR family transcriptional regulator